MTASATPSERPVKVLLTKSFIDSHDRAIKTIAVALREASMEVVIADYEIPEDIGPWRRKKTSTSSA